MLPLSGFLAIIGMNSLQFTMGCLNDQGKGARPKFYKIQHTSEYIPAYEQI